MWSSRRFFARLWNLSHSERAERELAREVAAHLALIEDDFLRRGLSPADARAAALRAYGGVEYAKDLHRDARSFVCLEQLFQDVRHACRSLAKSPGFVAVALLSLAFGIGVNTAIFTLVNGILLKTLPVADPHRIVQPRAHFKEFENSSFNFPVYRELRRQTSIFADVVGFSGRPAVLDIEGSPQKIDFELVTGSYFSFFGARPALGRLLDDGDDRVEGARSVCVLSYPAWQMYFGGNPSVVGRVIEVDRVRLQVVGVAAPEFVGAELQRRFDVWAPTALTREFDRNPREVATWIWLHALARLKPGMAFSEANARLKAASSGIEAALPKQRANANAVYYLVDASKGFDSWRSRLHDPLLILMGAVSLVLLVACANLTNLLLARTHERHQEFAIKLALGISRWRLLRELLTETFLVAFAGGLAAIFLAVALTRFLLALFNAGSHYQSLHVAPDAAVFLFTFGVCFLTALVAGFYPAWQATRTDAGPGLRGASLDGVRRSFVRRALILVQVTLAVVLLFGATLFARSLQKLKVIPLGYDIDHVLTVTLERRALPQTSPAPTPVLASVLARVRQFSGVEAASYSNPGVLSGSMMSAGVGKAQVEANFLFASPGYFSTLRIPLLRGRDFTFADRRAAPPVAIVNQRLASQLWPGQDPLGQHLDGWGLKNAEVVGVVGNSKYLNVREEIKSIVYQACEQSSDPNAVLSIRSRAPLGLLERDVRQIVKSDAPDFQVSDVTTMRLLRDNLIAQDRLLAFLSSLFGTLGVALALVGIYGLISYSVTRRTREIGIRMSIGAQRADVLWLFVRESAVLTAAGLCIGLPLALGLARFLKKMLYEVSTADLAGIWITLGLLALGGFLAAYLPGRRAARIDPMRALRYD